MQFTITFLQVISSCIMSTCFCTGFLPFCYYTKLLTRTSMCINRFVCCGEVWRQQRSCILRLISKVRVNINVYKWGLLCPWNFFSKSTGVGCHFLCRGSSQSRDWTHASCIFCKDRRSHRRLKLLSSSTTTTWEAPSYTVNWVKMKVAQLYLTPDPLDYTVHGILQTRILEWVAFPFSRGSSQPRDQPQVSHIAGRLFTSWATREALNTFSETLFEQDPGSLLYFICEKSSCSRCPLFKP